MSKFNITSARPAVTSPITGEHTPSGVTHQGGAGYARNTKSELFLLAVTNMVGENTFYEPGGKRDERYAQLVGQAALTDPAWTARFLRWLRAEANLRTASLVGAAEFVHARLTTDQPSDQGPSNRSVIDSVLLRADEPGELLAYWTSVHGRNVPKPVKRGIADAVRRLYDERALLKWDSAARGFRMGDVIDLVHPNSDTPAQGELYKHALDKRHNRANPIPESLALLRARAKLTAVPISGRRGLLHADNATEVLREAGMTWESLAGWLQGPLDARAWEAIIPTMGYMALLRNLRNFDEAGVSDGVAEGVAARLADPVQVARSSQLPMRFLSAHRAAPSLRWGHALDKALTASLANVPTLDGRTLILVDTSSSMDSGFSKDGTLKRWDAAAVFGIALGGRCRNAEVVSFSSAHTYLNEPPGPKTKPFAMRKGESLLRSVDRWKSDGYFLGGGTDTPGAIAKHLRPRFHNRLVIITDEQAAGGDVNAVVPDTMPLYTWNLAGYQHGHAPSGSGNRHTFGGLTDAGFRMIPLLEAGRSENWPF
ncbi:TROVE domain-containing protein [Actinokineospora alba]|uniref:TROVE domain-containing protein n=1 Tax=Actinokineospora alba TaxID=504798 RepID=A0A1H0PX03_9PSEU|nr:TROVE domain-containing protein [Actinokineospora alba]TDP65982.1 TROVE domain-containing protein [Actinokineospora alba]SDI60871.1 TROVE domain-containing protein [Actinokineospora alba]SDP09701.1 TROVE domain-containing protein [Actinokineospora alba]